MLDATIFPGLRLAEVSFDDAPVHAVSRTQGGDVIKHRLGSELWRGELSLVPARHYDQAAFDVQLRRLREADAAFFLYDPRQNGPSTDPGGDILSSATPTIESLPSGNRTLSLQGLPSGYEIPVGAYLGWPYGTSPIRYALHQVFEAVQADGAGVTPAFEVWPRIRPGASTGASVTLIRPVCKARILDVSFGAGRPIISAGATATWQQTLR